MRPCVTIAFEPHAASRPRDYPNRYTGNKETYFCPEKWSATMVPPFASIEDQTGRNGSRERTSINHSIGPDSVLAR